MFQTPIKTPTQPNPPPKINFHLYNRHPKPTLKPTSSIFIHARTKKKKKNPKTHRQHFRDPYFLAVLHASLSEYLARHAWELEDEDEIDELCDGMARLGGDTADTAGCEDYADTMQAACETEWEEEEEEEEELLGYESESDEEGEENEDMPDGRK